MRMRSKLFVPAIRPELFDKALRSEADAICFDLEDAVSLNRKAEARTYLASFLAHLKSSSPLILVRVNPVNSADFQADMDTCVGGAIHAVTLPKVDGPEDILAAERVLADLETTRELTLPIAILPTLETARGLRFAAEIALSSERVIGLQIGFADLFEPLGISADNDRARDHVRLQVRLAAAEAGIDCFDSVYANYNDSTGFEQHLQAAVSLGFAGTSCIHPSQIAAANRAFTPSDEEILYARRVIDAAKTAAAHGYSVTTVDGKMIDRPFVLHAQRLLARAPRQEACDASE